MLLFIPVVLSLSLSVQMLIACIGSSRTEELQREEEMRKKMRRFRKNRIRRRRMEAASKSTTTATSSNLMEESGYQKEDDLADGVDINSDPERRPKNRSREFYVHEHAKRTHSLPVCNVSEKRRNKMHEEKNEIKRMTNTTQMLSTESKRLSVKNMGTIFADKAYPKKPSCEDGGEPVLTGKWNRTGSRSSDRTTRRFLLIREPTVVLTNSGAGRRDGGERETEKYGKAGMGNSDYQMNKRRLIVERISSRAKSLDFDGGSGTDCKDVSASTAVQDGEVDITLEDFEKTVIGSDRTQEEDENAVTEAIGTALNCHRCGYHHHLSGIRKSSDYVRTTRIGDNDYNGGDDNNNTQKRRKKNSRSTMAVDVTPQQEWVSGRRKRKGSRKRAFLFPTTYLAEQVHENGEQKESVKNIDRTESDSNSERNKNWKRKSLRRHPFKVLKNKKQNEAKVEKNNDGHIDRTESEADITESDSEISQQQ